MKNTILIGPGRWGKILFENLERCSNLLYVLNSKSDLSREINGNIDWAIVSTPNDSHYEIVNILLEKNINVFCEKPLTLSSKKSYELVSKAKKLGLFLYINHIESFKKIKLNIDENNKIFRSKLNNKSYKEIVFDLVYHDMYLILKYIDINNFSFNSIIYRNNFLQFNLVSNNKNFEFKYNLNLNKKHEINGQNFISTENILPLIFKSVFSSKIDFENNNKEAYQCNILLEELIKNYKGI